MKILYAYPYYGEVGWGIYNWRSHLRYVFDTDGPFDHVFAAVRAGHEGLYHSFVSEFETFNEHEDCTEGNAFVLHRPDAYNHYKAHCVRCDQQVSRLTDKGHKVTVVRLPKKMYRYFRYKQRHCVFELLCASAEANKKWQGKVESTAVVLHLRHIKRSPSKNTAKNSLKTIARWSSKHGRQLLVVGRTTGLPVNFSVPGVDLLNKTTFDDLLAIYRLAGMVVGSSSGPMHLASATYTPHVVWGGGRRDIGNRYRKTWNPFQTPCQYFGFSFKAVDADLVGALDKLSANKLTNSIERVSKCKTLQKA